MFTPTPKLHSTHTILQQIAGLNKKVKNNKGTAWYLLQIPLHSPNRYVQLSPSRISEYDLIWKQNHSDMISYGGVVLGEHGPSSNRTGVLVVEYGT